VFQSEIIWEVFRLKKKEVGWEFMVILHNEVLHILYRRPDVVRTMISTQLRLAGHVPMMGENTDANRILVGKHLGKWPLERLRRRVLRKQVASARGGWNWFRIVSNGGHWY
jgi:hypothetical protein